MVGGADQEVATERLESRLLRQVGQASARWRLLEPGDRVMVCLSGGKDSWVMLHLLRLLQAKAPFRFELLAVNLDQGHPGFPVQVIRDYLEAHGYAYHLLHVDTYRVVQEKVPAGQTTCSLCSRLRRGILYTAAKELGCTKIALGHHRDDAIETLLLNLFFSGQTKAMPARLRSDDGEQVVIRPLLPCAEAEIAAYAALRGFPIVPCDLCGSQPNLQRAQIKRLLGDWESRHPRLRSSLFAALQNVRPSHLLDDRLLGGLEEEAELDLSVP